MISKFLTDNWSQILLLIGAVWKVINYFTEQQSRKDQHLYERSRTFNIDIDSLSDSFDLSQKMLAAVRTQLDQTQDSLDKANKAYAVLKIELTRAMQEIQAYKTKVAALGKENKELIARLNTCELQCEHKIKSKSEE